MSDHIRAKHLTRRVEDISCELEQLRTERAVRGELLRDAALKLLDVYGCGDSGCTFSSIKSKLTQTSRGMCTNAGCRCRDPVDRAQAASRISRLTNLLRTIESVCVQEMGDLEEATDRASPPGDTIRDLLEERGLELAEFAQRFGYTLEYTTQLLEGRMPITDDIAVRLAEVLGSSSQFWLTREAQYRSALQRRAKRHL